MRLGSLCNGEEGYMISARRPFVSNALYDCHCNCGHQLRPQYCNGFDESVARLQLGKHVRTRNSIGSCVFLCGLHHATVQSCVVCAWSVPRGLSISVVQFRVRSNTSTAALRVVGGDEKGTLESETVKYGRRPENYSAVEGRQQL
jgi:hypothetical protein